MKHYPYLEMSEIKVKWVISRVISKVINPVCDWILEFADDITLHVQYRGNAPELLEHFGEILQY